MEPDLLKKEEEFRKENEQLENQTRQLLEKLDILKNQENCRSDPTTALNYDKPTNHEYDESSDVLVTEANDAYLPQTVKDMGPRGMLHFYRAKTKSLQSANERLQQELKRKNDDIQKLTKDFKHMSEEKEKWFLQYTTEKNTTSKMEKQIQAHASRLQLKETENLNLKKELDQLRKDLKTVNIDRNSAETKFNRATQEMEKIKESYRLVKEEEKEIKESHRKDVKDLSASLRVLQKQKTELLHGYKKQVHLIDNLKKQKVILESLKATELAETDFNKLLDWKMDP